MLNENSIDVDIKNNIDNDAKLENAILNKAKKLRLSQS